MFILLSILILGLAGKALTALAYSPCSFGKRNVWQAVKNFAPIPHGRPQLTTDVLLLQWT